MILLLFYCILNMSYLIHLVFVVEKFPTFETLLGGEVVNMEWGAETPFRRTAGGLNMIGVIWLKRKS